MRFLLAVVIWLICLGLAIPFVTRTWWLPTAISQHARQVDSQFMLTLVVTGAIFILAQVALGYTVWRYGRSRRGAAAHFHGNNTMEVMWTAATATM